MRIDIRTMLRTECEVTRVLVGGADVSYQCFAADDVEGWADVYRLNSKGHKFIDYEAQDAAKTRLHSDYVEIIQESA